MSDDVLPVTWYLCPACLALHLVRLRYVYGPDLLVCPCCHLTIPVQSVVGPGVILR